MYLCFILYLNYLQNLNTYVLLSIKSCFFGARTARVFSFLEILAKPSWILTFSSCSCKEESRADHRGHVGLYGLTAISELKRTIILSALSALASASVSRTMFIHPNRFPFHRFSVICWTVWFAFSPADFLESCDSREHVTIALCAGKEKIWAHNAHISHIAPCKIFIRDVRFHQVFSCYLCRWPPLPLGLEYVLLTEEHMTGTAWKFL